MPAESFIAEPFSATPLLRNPHLQTLAGALLRRKSGIHYERIRIDTRDGDFLDLDFAHVPGTKLRDDAPLLLGLHGLEGSARQGYMVALYRAAAQAGIQAVGLNMRSCSGEMNRTARLYHLGATDDVAHALQWLEQRWPGRTRALVGFSLGANLTLKLLGEQRKDLPASLAAAVAISPPFDLTGKQALNQFPAILYGWYLLRKLKRKARLHAALIRQGGGDAYRAIQARTLREFDDAVTAPLHGFKDAEDYYACCGAGNFLSAIQLPVLLIRAQDDPFFNQDIPVERIECNPALVPLFPEAGGHVGFLELDLRQSWCIGEWAVRQALRFISQHLAISDRKESSIGQF